MVNLIKYKEKDFTKIRFESDDNLPLSKMLTITSMIVTVRSAFQKGNECYPQVYLYKYEYEFGTEL